MLIKAALLCKTLVVKLLASLKRFPETVLMAAATVSILIFLNHFDASSARETEELLIRTAMTFALGIPLSLCVKVLFERVPLLKKSTRVFIYIAAVAGLALYHHFLLRDFGMVSVSRYIAFSMSFYLAFAFIPYFYGRQNYGLYVIKLFISFFTTYLYSLILYAGLAAMLFTIDTLFSVNLPGKLYFDIWLIVAGVFAPAFFLADIPEYRQEFQIESYPKVLKVLLIYIVMPIIATYSAILYAYFAKIVTTWQWPHGMVSNLVLWYSIISTLVIFLIYPLRSINQWTRVFISYFPKLILPLLAMMFVAMGIRINAYGITESRYFVMLAGLWVTGCMLYFIFVSNPRNIALPVSLALISVLSVSGPWSSYSVSKLSQNMRFERILEKHDMIKAGSINKPSGELPETDKMEISEIIRYFNRYHSLDQLRYLPEDFRTDQMENLFGFPFHADYRKPGDREYFNYNVYQDNSLVDIVGFDYFTEVSPYRSTTFRTPEGHLEISYAPEKNQLKILERGEEIYSRNLDDLTAKLYELNTGKPVITKGDLSYLDDTEQIKVLYAFKHISGSKDRTTGEISIDPPEFYLFMKLNRD